jgi:hypothetical protein
MSFDKDYPNRKDWRRPYYKSKAFDRSCRNHGDCDWCRGDKLHQLKKEKERIESFFENQSEEQMIIGLSGKKKSGKDTVANMLKIHLQNTLGKDFQLIAFADEIKRRCQKDFNLSNDQLYGDLKEEPDTRYPKKIEKLTIEIRGFSQQVPIFPIPTKSDFWTPREILQNYGSFFRSIDPNFWVKLLFSKIDGSVNKNFIIIDCRLKTEIDPILDRYGTHIKIIRPDLVDDGVGKNDITETELDDDYRVTFKIFNNGTLDELKQKISQYIPICYD